MVDKEFRDPTSENVAIALRSFLSVMGHRREPNVGRCPHRSFSKIINNCHCGGGKKRGGGGEKKREEYYC